MNEQENQSLQLEYEQKADKARRLRHGSVAMAITAAVIVAVILLNVCMTALSAKFLWYVDMTGEVYDLKNPEYKGLYSLMDQTKEMLQSTFDSLKAQYNGDDSVVDIIFCDDPDVLVASTSQRLVYYTALQLQKAFPKNIRVQCIDIYNNASAVQKYKTNSAANIYSTQVIISSGSEYRIMSPRAFFVFSDSDSSEPWAYNGEKYFTSSIIAVTKAEAPICAVTNNHGEQQMSATMWSLIENAGYTVQYLNLETEEIPEDCRLIITYGPTKDFKSRFDGEGVTSEIEKLDKFLDKTYGFAVFFNETTPVLKNFEEYLSEWGVVINRSTNAVGESFNYLVQNQKETLTGDGFTFVGEYTTIGSGSGITNDMRTNRVAPKVVFRNSTALSYDKTYVTKFVTPEEDDSLTSTYSYASRYSNGVSRTISNVFTAGADARVWIQDGEGAPENNHMSLVNEDGQYPLMTLTTETKTEQESNYTSVNHTAYLLACASTDFMSDALLQSEVYGNADVLLAALRSMGKEVVAVNIPWKSFQSTTIKSDVMNEKQARTTATVLTLLPVVLCAGVGIYIVVRRKFI